MSLSGTRPSAWESKDSPGYSSFEMRQRFIGWYGWTPEQLSTIWDDAIFVPDANILLHCLRHPEVVREQLLRFFELLKESIWVPYQVGLEFHRNRLDVEFGARDAYDRVTKECTAALDQARTRLRQLRAHPVIEVKRELAALDRFETDFRGRLQADKANHPVEAIADAVERLSDLLACRVGEKWAPERLKALRKEGEERYANKIPPGYMDSKKDAGQDSRLGDLIIWKDMLAKAKTDERPIVFISDDAKEDWWWIHRGQRLGARPELIEECKEVSGQYFHIYQFSQFLRIAADRHPEINEGVCEIEKSLRDDEIARGRLHGAAEAKALRTRMSELETERDVIISTLSGLPMRGEFPEPSTDRSAVLLRLKALNAELDAMNAALVKETVQDK